jgi:phosphoenolpyruvate carboxylase
LNFREYWFRIRKSHQLVNFRQKFILQELKMKSNDYSTILQDQIAILMIEIVGKQNQKQMQYLSQIFALSKSKTENKDSQYENLLDQIETNETRQFLEELMELESKIVDMEFRARTSAGVTILQALHSNQNPQKMIKSGDTFYEVIGRCAHAGLHKSLVQEMVNNIVLWPSLTTHPTNPTSVNYTAAALEVQNLLANPDTTRENLIDALRVVIETPMDEPLSSTGTRKKTPQTETEELLLILDGIYNGVNIPAQKLREALNLHGYETVSTKKSCLLDLNIWGAGDGDGNPNMNAQILEDCVLLFRTRIKQRYVEDLSAIASDQYTPSSLQSIIKEFLQKENGNLSKNLLKEWVEQHPAVPGLHEIYLRFKIFGNCYAKIDVRHNAVDLMNTLTFIFVKTHQIESAEFFHSLPQSQQYDILSQKLNDSQFMEKCASLEKNAFENPDERDGQLAWRLLSRARVMAKYPDMFSKFIIAETRTTNDALGALLLLKLGGCLIASPRSLIDVVPLFESREDLIHAPFVVHTLASEGLFAEHLKLRGYFLVMIAKSDTARLSGPGVQGQQEATYGKLLSMNSRTYGGIQMFVMLGGGDDQMRGGGRIVESPHVILRAAAREGGRNPCKIAMTIQGQQMQLVFGTIPATAHFVEAFCSQSLLANARIQGLLPWRPVTVHLNEIAAERQAMDFFNKTMNNYETLIGGYDLVTKLPSDNRRTIIDYFLGFPSIIIEMTNKSSRPGARVKTIDPLEGRAISLDQRSKHDGSYLTATIGVADSLEYLLSMIRVGGPDELSTPPYSPMTPVRHCYLANKSFRDFVRMQATVLHHKDHVHAWNLRGGVPTSDERKELLSRYRDNGYNAPRVFLAKLEERDNREATILFHAISGQPIPDSCSLKLPLEYGWPAVAKQMDFREEQSRFSKVVERLMAVKLTSSNIPPDEKEKKTIEWAKRMAYYAYVGANPASTTPSFSMTMTDPYKEGKTKLDQKVDLPLPFWINKDLIRNENGTVGLSKL